MYNSHKLRKFGCGGLSEIARILLAATIKTLGHSSLLILLSFSAGSLGGQAIVTELNAMKSVVERTADGAEKETLVPIKTALPGERVVYTLNYGNKSETPVNDVVISLPMPQDMSFLPGSADQTGTSVTYSIDGGKTFDLLERLTVTDNNGFERPARGSDVTVIRWTIADALQPMQFGSLRCVAAIE